MATSSTRVNLISLFGLLLLAAVITLTPEARQLMSRFAEWLQGVEKGIESRRERPATPGDGASQGEAEATKGEEAEEELPPHVVAGPDGSTHLEPGYGWSEDKKAVVWLPGSAHPEHPHVFASNEPDQWKPGPGYDWANPSGVNDMRVVWTPGKRHPLYEHVIAIEEADHWRPEEGWDWVTDDPNDLSVKPDKGDE